MPSLRPYTASDWDAFIALEIEVVGIGLPSHIDPKTREDFEGRLPQHLRDAFDWDDQLGPRAKASQLTVLESDDGEYAGHLWLTDTTEHFLGRSMLHITSVGVHASFRGRGWGRLLMERAIECGRERRLDVQLGVAATNTVARGLYLKLGFDEVKVSMVKVVDK